MTPFLLKKTENLQKRNGWGKKERNKLPGQNVDSVFNLTGVCQHSFTNIPIGDLIVFLLLLYYFLKIPPVF